MPVERLYRERDRVPPGGLSFSYPRFCTLDLLLNWDFAFVLHLNESQTWRLGADAFTQIFVRWMRTLMLIV